MADEPPFTAYMVACEFVILNELKVPRITQRYIAQSYAHAIRSTHAGVDAVDWKVVNEAITAKWGAKGLERVKKMAWSGKCWEEKGVKT